MREKELEQLDSLIAECQESSDTIIRLMKTATDLNELFRLGRLLSESHGEEKAYRKAKQIILNGNG